MLLSSFISFVPISTIIACNNPKIGDEEPDIDKDANLFNTIKTKILDTLNNPEEKIHLDDQDLNKSVFDLKKLLQPIFEKAKGIHEQKLNEEVFIDDDNILTKISDKVNKNIVSKLNIILKEISALENLEQVISLSNLKAKMNGNDIDTLTKLLNDGTNETTQHRLEGDNHFYYNLQLTLQFNINIKTKSDTFTYSSKSAFITSNKNNLNLKIFTLADKLSEKLANRELDGKKVIDNVLNDKSISYEQSFSSELNNILKNNNIKIEKSESFEINREQLSFQLSVPDLANFADYILKEENIMTTIEEMFNKELHQFYQFKGYTIKNDKVFTWNLEKFVLNKWSIEGIELPKRNLTNIKIYHKKNDIEDSWRIFYGILRNYFNPNIWFRKTSTGYYLESIWIKKDFISHDEIKKLSWRELMDKWVNNIIKSKISNEYLSMFEYKFEASLDLSKEKVKLQDWSWPYPSYAVIAQDKKPKLNFIYYHLLLRVNKKSEFTLFIEKQSPSDNIFF